MGELAGKRIGLLTASASHLGGGVAEAVVQQAQIIERLGAEPVVLTLDDAALAQDRARFGPVTIHPAKVIGPRQIGFAPGLLNSMKQAGLDLLHLHGIWQYPSRAAWLWGRNTQRPVIVSPHGMLAPWIVARSRMRKAAARAGYERKSWRDAAALHALTQAEAADISDATGREARIVIPNAAPRPANSVGTMPPPRLLYLGRIHPKKNVAALIEAWRMADKPEGARLQVAGWGDESDVRPVAEACAALPDAEFLGPLHGEAKEAAFRDARFAILPSLSEGLPMVMLEAWAAGRPTIMSAECHLPEGFAKGAAIACGTDPAPLVKTIDTALIMDESRWRGMAKAALALAAGPFGAAHVARQWEKAYSSCMNREAT